MSLLAAGTAEGEGISAEVVISGTASRQEPDAITTRVAPARSLAALTIEGTLSRSSGNLDAELDTRPAGENAEAVDSPTVEPTSDFLRENVNHSNSDSAGSRQELLSTEAAIRGKAADVDLYFAPREGDSPLSGETTDVDTELETGFIEEIGFPQDMTIDASDARAWSVDSQAVNRLRHTLDASSSSIHVVRDAALVSWFAGPGGLIDLGNVVVDFTHPVRAGGLIDIELDTTLGLHRSVDLIVADGEFTETELRDAVLAALAGGFVETAQPVAKAAAGRSFSKVAYGGAALIGASLVAASQRRRRQLMQTSRNRSG